MSYAIDFNQITSKAYYALYSLKGNELPVDPVENRFVNGSVIVISYQRYACIAGIDAGEISCGGELKDGFSILSVRGKYLILFDDSVYLPRRRYTVAHEIGHFALGHRVHGPKEEIEANFFASQFLAPTAIFHEIRNRGYGDSYEQILSHLKLSREARQRKLDYLEKYGLCSSHITLYDDYVHDKFKGYLDRYYPAKIGSLRHIWENNATMVKQMGW